jgi:hypothetical protein
MSVGQRASKEIVRALPGQQAAIDGGDASVKLSRTDMAIAKKEASRTASDDPESDPTTGA